MICRMLQLNIHQKLLLFITTIFILPFNTIQAQWYPGPGWMDSYKANGFCWCQTNFDHGLDKKTVEINGTDYLVKDICDELEKHPLFRAIQEGDPRYNDIQCGNGPPNDAADEEGCPGRVDKGPDGCSELGPGWDMEWLSSRERFGGSGTPASKIQIKVMLEGFFAPTSGLMNSQLAQLSLIPSAQPFNTPPFNYEGTESVNLLEEDIIDWVLVEVRDSSDRSKVLARKAALLDQSGTIRDISNTTYLSFNQFKGQSHHIAVYHKSHLAIMSSEPILFNSDDPVIYDFSSSMTKAIGNDQMKEVNGVFVMYGGDFDQNGLVNNLDFNLWGTNGATLNDYLPVDADGNGIVNNLDFNMWSLNRSKIGIVEMSK